MWYLVIKNYLSLEIEYNEIHIMSVLAYNVNVLLLLDWLTKVKNAL